MPILQSVLILALASSATAAGAEPERLAADTPKATVSGNTFIVPAGWSISLRGPATITC